MEFSGHGCHRSPLAVLLGATRPALAIALVLLATLALTSDPPPDPDLDVDSDNTDAWGYPDRSDYEEAIEAVVGNPQYPGRFVPVNDDDDDGDGIPDFADGYNWDGEWGNDDDTDSYCDDDVVPIVLELPEPFDPWTARVEIVYDGSPPGSQVYLPGVAWGVARYGDPPVYVPAEDWGGSLRIWSAWSGCSRNPAHYGSYGGGDYVGPAPYAAWELGFSDECRTITLYVEAAKPSLFLADAGVWMFVDPDGTAGDYPYEWPYADMVRLTAVRIDLDVDSDNTNGLDDPARTDYEDQTENVVGKPEYPGKFVPVNDGDDDGDGIPDFADGFNRDAADGTDDDLTGGKRFVRLMLEIPHPLWDIPDVAQNGEVTFTYDASDPAQVAHDEQTGIFTPAPGTLRLWRKDGGEARSSNSVAAAESPGDFIPSGSPVRLSALGLTAANRVVTLYAEGIRHVAGSEAESVAVRFDPDGQQGPLQAICRDVVRVRPVRIEFVVPDACESGTGLPAAGAAATPTNWVPVSDPRPVVALDEIGAGNVGISNGTATVTVSGTVRDPIADNTPRGGVSQGRADIESVHVYVNGVEACDPAGVQSQDDGQPSLFRQHPYRGTFGPVAISFPASTGTHTITVETSANAAGRTGRDSIEVRLDSREVPGTACLGGALTLTANLYFPAEPGPATADVVQYYYGQREPQEGDPFLAENAGEEASLEFHGQLDGVPVQIAVTDFAGLTEQADTLDAEIACTWPDGGTMRLAATFTETGPATRLFRGALSLEPCDITSVQNLHLPAEPGPAAADSMRFFLGDREPEDADPLLTEAQGEENSLVFRGTVWGLPTTVSVTEFTGLTGNVDSLTAEVRYDAGDGNVWTRTAHFTETGATTSLFRASTVIEPGPPGGEFALTTHYRVVVPANPDPNQPDTLRFYLGDAEPPDGGTTLTETEDDSGLFAATLENGAAVRVQIVQFNGLSDNVDQATLRLTVGHPDLPTYSFERTYTETGAATNTFDYTEPGDVPRSTHPCVEAVRNVDEASENHSQPVTLRIRGLADAQCLTARMPGGAELPLADPCDGVAAIAFGSTLIVGVVLRGEGGTQFLYWDADQQALATIAFGEGAERWNAELLRGGACVVAARSAQFSELRFVDADGAETTCVEPVPVQMLLDTLGDQEVVLEDPCFARLRVHGFNSRTAATLTSEELASDGFELVMADGSPSVARHDSLLDEGDYAESEKRICLYEPDAEHPQLTDAQWQALADLGILAVHNAGAAGKAVNGAQEVLKGFHDHHLFSQLKTNPHYSRFWTDAFGGDFDIDDFTVPVKPEKHWADMNQITKRWTTFIDKQRELMKAGKPIRKVQAHAIDEMLNIADDHGYDVSQVRRFHSKAPRGSSLAKLYRHAQKAGKIDLKANARWRQIIGRAAKRLGRTAMQVLKFAGYALTAYYVVNFAADPAGAAAADLGISRDTFLGWIEGRVYARIELWPSAGADVDAIELLDGSLLVSREWYSVSKYDPKDKKFHQYKYLELTNIVVRGIPGTADLTFDDGSQKGLTLEDVRSTVQSEP
ncbi:MAG TPA: hypothetical protein VNE39_07700 [Planctomycetota bacterium]|nr:hypothetical protein [Planctomycetota bacterium]